MTHPLASDEHILCAVCRGRAGALGYKPSRHQPALWLCDDALCQSLVKKVHAMPKETLDAYEYKAAIAAGDEAGEYLDQIGKTDLAALDRDEWEEFLGRIVMGFQLEMRRLISSNEAPF
jgi:hypothetical protein